MATFALVFAGHGPELQPRGSSCSAFSLADVYPGPLRSTISVASAMRDQETSFYAASVGAGLAAGTARVLVGHPFDTMKVLRQTGATEVLPRSPAAALQRLYRGCGPPLLSVGIYSSAAFGLYEGARQASAGSIEVPPLLSCFVAGTVSGAILAFPTCPLANLSVLRQTSPGETGDVDAARRSSWAWARRLVAERGPSALFRGLGPHLVQAGFGRGFYMLGYEFVKGLEDSAASDEWEHPPSTTLPGKILAGSFAGISGWIFTYPFDVARSNVIRDWRCERYSGALAVMRALYSEGGLPRVYAGLSYTVVRAVPVAAVTLPVYELSQRHLAEAFRAWS